jgi:S-DNA-T family DNA segregation ATPase FtsK/SpoIIIE
MSETKKKTTESKTKKSAAEKKTASKTNKKTTVKKSTEPKAKRLTKEEKAALEREQARLAAEKAERDKEKRAIKDEVAIIISIAVAILLLLSNFKLSGIVGEVVNGALFGLFGWLAYLVPLLIVVLVCFFLANRNNGFRFVSKIITSFMIFILMAAMIQIAVGETTQEMQALDYYNYAKAHKSGGGVVGGVICRILVQWFDIVGSYIILATLEIICIFFITGRALLKNISEKIKERNAEKIEKRKEINELYDEYLTTEEAEEYLEKKQTVVESMLPGNHDKKTEPPAPADAEEDEDDTIPVPTSGIGVMLPVDYPDQRTAEISKKEYEEREFEESLRRSHLDKKTDRKERGGKFNFFGGRTETRPFGKNAEEEKASKKVGEPLTEEEEKPEESLYETELNKKFFGKKNVRDNSKNDNRAISIFKPRTEVKEYVTDNDDDLIDDRFADEKAETGNTSLERDSFISTFAEPAKEKIDISFNGRKEEKKEMSFSETSLRDKSEFNYNKEELAKTVDSVPYALSAAANRPLQYKKPSKDEKTETTDAVDTSGSEPITLREETTTEAVERQIEIVMEEKNSQMAFEPAPKEYAFPPIELLDAPVRKDNEDNTDELEETADKLQRTLDSFGVRVTVTDVQRGPSVTRYELQPEVGVKVSRITNLADDIKLNLAAADIRIEAPIPGKAAVGIEVPNRENTMVTLRELIESDEFANARGKIPFTVGKSIEGANVIGDIAKMPHLMIAGATGSGKSVCINTIIMSILYEFKPDDVKLIMIDPKVVELSVYNGIPHLLIPVVTDPKKAASALNWACVEMDERYKKFAELSVRDLKGYNERVKAEAEKGNVDENYPVMPQMVIIVDELADLMMVASNEVEDSICRLAQKARACGMHLIIATQRPSVNVITGLIKANIPSRIAFAVSSGVDSRTILDNVGAEKLLGKGDMLYYPTGMSKPVRIQGCFVSDKEVNAVVNYITKVNDPAVYNESINEKIARVSDDGKTADSKGVPQNDDGRDEYFEDAGRLIIEKEKASIGMLQRAYKIGFNRAARIMDQLAEAGVVSEEDGNKPRQILMTASDYENMLQSEGK